MSCVDHTEVMILKYVQKSDIEYKKLRVTLFQFKKEEKDLTMIWSIYSVA